MCSECGVYMGALLATDRGHFATLNVNTMAGVADVPAAQPVSYDGESIEQRIARRETRWTPVIAVEEKEEDL